MKHLVLSILVLSIFPIIAFGQDGNASEYENQAGISGVQNSTFGQKAGASNKDKDNVFVGYASGAKNEGSNNVFVGSQSGAYNTKGSENVFLGFQSGIKTEGSSNLLYIENSSSNKPLIWGDFKNDIANINGKLGVGNNNPQEALHINGNIRGNQQSGSLRINTTAGYIDIGPKNSAWAHIYTDRSKFIFNKDAYTITGGFSSYSASDLALKTNGATRLTVKNATGNVGVGTINPLEKFDVNGTAKSKRLLVESDVENSLLELNGPLSSRLLYYTGADIYSGLKLNDQADKTRVVFSVRSGQHTFFRLNDKNGTESIGLSEGSDIGNFMHLPKAKSRIVISGWGSYLLDEGHKLVVKDGSAKIEGNIITNSKLGVGIASTEIPVDYKVAVAGKIIAEEVRVELLNTWPDYVFNEEYNLRTLKEVEEHIHKNGHLQDIPSANEVEKNGLLVGEMNAKLLQKIEELTLYTIQQEKEIHEQGDEIKYLKTELENRLDKLESLLNSLKQ